jgi:predicted RNA-binding protein Jag
MSEKKGFFNFLKGWSSPALTEEEKQQREYARNQVNNEKHPKQTANTRTTPVESTISDEIETFCVEKLEEFLYLSKFSGKVRSKGKEGNKLSLDIFDAGEDAGRLIGKSGQTLSALQTLVRNFVIRKYSESIKISIDAGDYRSRRFSQIKTKALKAAERVKNDGKKVFLDPMSPSERRPIHILFENDQDIKTLSEGSGHNRRIVLVKPTPVTAE